MSGREPVAHRAVLIAHRGDHRGAPENSLAAFRAAVAAGCDGAELDVRRARDGVAIVLHDATLDRVQRRPWTARSLTAAELAEHGVPTLEAALRAVPATFLVDVELKEATALEPAIAAIESVRGAAARAVVLSSFRASILAAARSRRPGWPRWLIATDRNAVVAAARSGCAAIALRADVIDAATVAGAHARGLRVVAWTVRDRAVRDALTAAGVDVICVEGAALVT